MIEGGDWVDCDSGWVSGWHTAGLSTVGEISSFQLYPRQGSLA